ncbi:MAG: sigma-54 dependent transcriptional regulator [Acidobacteria bacterium]|nr:sigma-54 dependent transcriptional regulator [Acidobacteriota bacterium]
MTKPILVVEDDSSVRTTLTTFLELEGYTVEAVATTGAAIEKLSFHSYPLVLSDIYIDERTGLDVLNAAKKSDPNCAVILMTGRGTMETVMAATRGGAFDYIAKPFDLDTLLETVRKAEASMLPAEDEDDDDEVLPSSDMVGSSSEMVSIYKTISRVAPTDATVMIEGETGTGKEMIARMIHQNSPRASHPFVPVDCGSIPASLLESELFGAMRGSYTGADRDRVGVFEAAHRGTVFLDEIGDIDGTFQLKLLRFLQEKEVRPLGSSKAKPVDVRIVAATNRDMKKLVDEGTFREDLWFRLNVVPLQLPPLRERRGDVALLARTFLRRYNDRYHQSTVLLDSGLRALEDYTWPGNVRQLQHMVERLSILAPQGRISDEAVRDAIADSQFQDTDGETLAETEKEQIRRVMAAANNNKSRAAKILGIERKTLYRKLERMGLS